MNTIKLIDKNPNDNKLRAFIVTGDEYGRIRLWDLTPVFTYYGIKPTIEYYETKTYFNPRRNENVDVTLQTKISYRK